METIYRLLPSDYNEVQVLFFHDEQMEEWYVDERSLATLSGLDDEAFVKALNRADFRRTRKGRWVVSILDAYLILPEDARSWMHTEQFVNLPLRLLSGKRHDAILLSLEETTRRYLQMVSLRSSRGNRKEVHVKAIRSRLENNVRMLAKYGLNENNSAIIRSAVSLMKVRNDNGTTTV